MLKRSIIVLAILASTSALSAPTITIKSINSLPELRIVGGEESTPHFRSYQVSLQSTSGSHFCGGSIVADDLILTAAHCMRGVDGNNPQMQVRVGAHSLTDGSGQVIQVATTYTNQEYPNLSKDVAILKLVEKITDKNAKALTLADETFFTNNIKVGSLMTVSGWGTLTSGGAMPDKLMEVAVPYVTNEICNSPEAYNGEVQVTEMCAGYKEGGKDSCQGDSGGPLVVAKGDSFVQIGVVSWGEGCASANKYGVYGNVSTLKSWLDSAMAGNEPASGLAGGGDTGGGDTGGGDGGEPDEQERTYFAFQETINYQVGDEAIEFVLDVPEGINVIYIATRGGEGDVDLTAELMNDEQWDDEFFDYYGFSYDYSSLYYSAQEGNDEMIVIERPTSGEWKITLSNFGDYSDVELTFFAH